MSLTRKPKDIQKTVKLLTEPEPAYVSLVEHGANQTPFKVVKSLQYKLNEKDAEEMINKTARQVAKSAENTLKSADDKAIVGIRFASEQFPDEASVTKWLEEGGYQDFTVKAIDSGFEVSSTDEGDAFGADTTELDTGIGVKFQIASLSAAKKEAGEGEEEVAPESGKESGNDEAAAEAEVVADPAAEAVVESGETSGEEAAPAAEEEVEKTASQKSYDALSVESTQKFDMFGAWFSDKADLAGVLKDSNDGIPMGYGELMFAFETALMNASRENDEAAVKQAFKDVSKVFLGLWKVAEKIGAPAEGEAAARAAEPTAEAPAEVTAPQEDVVAKAVAEAVAKAIADTTSLIETKLNETVAAISTKADEVAGVAEAARKLAEEANTKASQLEGVTQARKSADVGDFAGKSNTQNAEDEVETTKKDAAFSQRMLASTLGF